MTNRYRKYFDNDNLNIEYSLVDKKYGGFYKEYDELRNLHSSITYKKGLRDGITTIYYFNGVRETEILYAKNEFV